MTLSNILATPNYQCPGSATCSQDKSYKASYLTGHLDTSAHLLCFIAAPILIPNCDSLISLETSLYLFQANSSTPFSSREWGACFLSAANTPRVTDHGQLPSHWGFHGVNEGASQLSSLAAWGGICVSVIVSCHILGICFPASDCSAALSSLSLWAHVFKNH